MLFLKVINSKKPIKLKRAMDCFFLTFDLQNKYLSPHEFRKKKPFRRSTVRSI